MLGRRFPSRTRWSALALAAVAAVLIPLGASGALAAGGTTVKLNLDGGYANHQKVACGDLHHYTYYHAGHTNKFEGSVSPAPSGHWRIKLKIKKCRHGTFDTVWQKHFRGMRKGLFNGSFVRRGRGFYYARAYYYGVTPAVQSDKEHFRITH